MTSTSNTVPTTPRASRASGRTLQKTEAELEDAQREIQLLRSELVSVKLEKEELAETNRSMNLLESDERLRVLKDVKNKYSHLKKRYKDLKKNHQEVKQDLGLELKAKTDAISKFNNLRQKYEGLKEEHQDAQEKIERLRDLANALKGSLTRELERRLAHPNNVATPARLQRQAQAQAHVASQVLVLHEATPNRDGGPPPPVQTPNHISINNCTFVFRRTPTSVSLQINNV